jgi:hypothetical protein
LVEDEEGSDEQGCGESQADCGADDVGADSFGIWVRWVVPGMGYYRMLVLVKSWLSIRFSYCVDYNNIEYCHRCLNSEKESGLLYELRDVKLI